MRRLKTKGSILYHRGRAYRYGDLVSEEVAKIMPHLFEDVEAPKQEPDDTKVAEADAPEEGCPDPDDLDPSVETEFPIEDYDSLRATEVIETVEQYEFTAEELREVLEYEEENKDRKTVKAAILEQLEAIDA